ncbi:MAG: hypothetical protein KJ052_09680 [Candidatus Hydrogenedentes bacterium]|nr:hypothetical protein [Candidatus Hydrogenedentota bacterium]
MLNALIVYAQLGTPCPVRLMSMYKASPLMPFGETWSLEHLVNERAALLETLEDETQTVGEQAKCPHCS